jgi:hypothetical protein
MAQFGIRFFDHGNRIYDERRFSACDADEAMLLAPKLFASGIGKGFHVMDGARVLSTHINPSSGPAPALVRTFERKAA